MKVTTVTDNLATLEAIKRDHPEATHILLRREDDVLIDQPIFHADLTIRNHPTWRIVGHETAVKSPLGQPVSRGPIELPLKPSEEAAAAAGDIKDKLSATVNVSVIFTDESFVDQNKALKKAFPKMHKALTELSEAVEAAAQ